MHIRDFIYFEGSRFRFKKLFGRWFLRLVFLISKLLIWIVKNWDKLFGNDDE